MNAWFPAAAVLSLGLLPALVTIVRGSFEDGLVALAGGSTVTVLAMATVGIGVGRPAFLDAALLLALVSFVGMLAAARFLERWL